LDANDGDEVTRLSVFKSLSGVANGPSVDNVIFFVEFRKGLVFKIPSAGSPGVSTSVESVPHSNINFTILALVPTENLRGLVPSLGISGLWVSISNVGVSIEREVFFTGNKITHSANSIWVRFDSWSERSDLSLGGIINITKVGEWSLQGSESPNGGWSDTEIVEGKEVGVDTSGSLNDTNLEVGEGNKLSVDQVISLGVSWCSVHDIELWVLIGEGDSWDHISTEIDTEDEYG